jgi:Zn-dependent protease with chaperone function
MTFFEAQAEHRDAARLWALGCVALAFAFAVVAGGLLSMVVAIPVWVINRAFPPLFGFVFAGTAIVFLMWLGLRAALSRDGGHGLALAIGARAPRPGDLEERQLQNVTEEMAIAAGMPPPRVLLLDRGPPNAAVAGTSPEDATVIVTRATLDGLNRDETQAVLGHALATIANGDPRLSVETLAVCQTFGLLIALCEAPINRSMRHAASEALKAIGGAKRGDTADRDKVYTQLLHALSFDTVAESGEFVEKSKFAYSPRMLFSLPFFGVSLIVKLVLFILILLLVGPFLWTMQRKRRWLADATAVQLTRQVDPLIRALETLKRDGGIGKGLAWAEHLFVVGSHTDRRKVNQYKDDPTAPDSLPVIMFGVQPPLFSRLKRLRAIGGATA